MLATNLPCPTYDKLYIDGVLKGPGAQSITSQYKEYFKFLESKTGVPSIGLNNFYWIADPFICQVGTKSSEVFGPPDDL